MVLATAASLPGQTYRRSYDPNEGWAAWQRMPTQQTFQGREGRQESWDLRRPEDRSGRDRSYTRRNRRGEEDLTYRERQYRDWLYRDPHTYDPWGYEDSRDMRPDNRWIERQWARDRRAGRLAARDGGTDQRFGADRFRGRPAGDQLGPDEFADEWTESGAFGPARRDFAGRRFDAGPFDSDAALAGESTRDFDNPAALGNLGADREGSREFRNPGGTLTTNEFRRSWLGSGGLAGGQLGGPAFGDAGFDRGAAGFDDGRFGGGVYGDAGFGGTGFGGATFRGGPFGDSGLGSGIAGPGLGNRRLGTTGGLGGGGFDSLGTVGGSIGAPGAGIDW